MTQTFFFNIFSNTACFDQRNSSNYLSTSMYVSVGPVEVEDFLQYFPLLLLFTSSVACNDSDIQVLKLNAL